MPVHIPSSPDGFVMSAAVRAEAWEIAFEQAVTHEAVMTRYSEAWAQWNSAAKRGALTQAHLNAVRMADAARARSLSVEMAKRSGT